MNKQIREKVFNKYGGRCCFCGCDLKSNFSVDSGMPCCQTCKANKKSMSIESFRKFIQGRVVALRRDSKAFRMAEDFGLVRAVKEPVVFYFEKVGDFLNKEKTQAFVGRYLDPGLPYLHPESREKLKHLKSMEHQVPLEMIMTYREIPKPNFADEMKEAVRKYPYLSERPM